MTKDIKVNAACKWELVLVIQRVRQIKFSILFIMQRTRMGKVFKFITPRVCFIAFSLVSGNILCDW